MIHLVLGFGLLSALLQAPRDPAAPRAALAEWRAEHGGSWQMLIDEETGYGRFLYNGMAQLSPAPVSDEEFVAAAREVLATTEGFHGLEPETLVDPRATFLPLGLVGTTDKLSVELRQEVGGVPVVRGFANVLFDARGSVLSVDTTGLPRIAELDVRPVVTPEQALSAALFWFGRETGLPPTHATEPALVIDQVLRGGARVPVLAWHVDVQFHEQGMEPEGFLYSVDARDGSLARRERSVHNDVSGNVQSLVTPGEKPHTPSNPGAPEAMRRIQVTSEQGIVFTDENGDFTIPGASPPLSVTLVYEGTHCRVVDAAGGNHALVELLTESSGNTILMNPLGDPLTTAEANAFDWINKLRDWTRTLNPSDTVSEFQALANVNLPGPCNAFWTNAAGGSVNFFVENICVNSAYSTVIAHEMGHWYNQRYGSGNGPDGFGEGNADVFAMYLLDTPIVGRDFTGPGGHIRSGNNNRQFCGDCCPGCHPGGVHGNGEVLMGALWKVRTRLKDSYGVQEGGLIADLLFNSWMNAYNDGQIKSIIEIHWLVLDDDDGNIFNGTPHYSEIDGGFRQQGFPGVDIVSCPEPSIYCVTAPNSAGSGALIGWTGTASIAANELTLTASGVPPGQFGLFFYGLGETQVAFGDGFRCVDGAGTGLFRLGPPTQADSFGDNQRLVDLGQPPAGSGPGAIVAGSTWKFQHWYRDPTGPGGSGFNLTDALSAGFCP